MKHIPIIMVVALLMTIEILLYCRKKIVKQYDKI